LLRWGIGTLLPPGDAAIEVPLHLNERVDDHSDEYQKREPEDRATACFGRYEQPDDADQAGRQPDQPLPEGRT